MTEHEHEGGRVCGHGVGRDLGPDRRLDHPERFDELVAFAGRGGAPSGRVGVRRARAGELVDAYPAGTHDRELVVEGHVDASDIDELSARILAADPRCRRIVLPVAEQQLAAIAWAEQAGYRYVVDVETRSGACSLLVREPGWVVDQPAMLDEIPLKE